MPITRKLYTIIIAEAVVIILLVCGIVILAQRHNAEPRRNTATTSVKTTPAAHSAQRTGLGSNNTSEATLVEAVRVKKKRMGIFLVANCNIEAANDIYIPAKIDGEIQQIFVEEGDITDPGNILAKIDDKEAGLALKEAKVKLESSRLLYKRAKDSFDNRIISMEDFEEYKLGSEMAQVSYAQRKLELGYYSVTSPISGTVVERHIVAGGSVKAGDPLFRVARLDNLYGTVYIPEKDVHAVALGQTARLFIESIPEKRFSGTVNLISPVIDPQTGTVKVVIKIAGKQTTILRPGMFSTVHILTDEHENALAIPKKALISGSIEDEVFVIKYIASISLPEGTTDLLHKAVNIDVTQLPDGKRSPLPAKPLTGKITAVNNPQPVAEINGKAHGCQVSVELQTGRMSPINYDGSIVAITIGQGDDTPDLQLHDITLSIEALAYKMRTTLGFSEGNEVEALIGIAENDLIVTAGHEDLLHGSRVSIVGSP